MDKKYILIGVVVAIIVVVVGLYASGMLSNSFFVAYGTEYGPGTYKAGVDIPEGYYEVKGEVKFSGVLHGMSSQGNMKAQMTNQLYDNEGKMHLKQGDSVTVPSGGSIKYAHN